MSLAINIKNTFSTSRGWFLLCLAAMAVGLSLSKPLITLGLFGLLIVWVVDGNIIGKLKSFLANKPALMISSIYLISLLGLIHTNNFDYAFDDLRRKITILALPLFVSGFNPITKKELHFLLKTFILGVFTATLWSLFVFLGGLNEVIIETRSLSRFTSHIRFGLEIALAAFLSIYFFQKECALKFKILWLPLFFWLSYSLFLFHLFTGGIVFILTAIILTLVYGYFSRNRLMKTATVIVFIGAIAFSIFYINGAITSFYATKNVIPLKELSTTKSGETYKNSTDQKQLFLKENGYFIYKNIAWDEFSKAWNKRSEIDFNGKDLKGQHLKQTLIRFITSKGLRKNKEAIEGLTKEEITAIEKGIPNHKFLTMNSFSLRIHKIIWEYDAYSKSNGKHINGHSILMRWEYWKTALNIIKENLFFGVGTGDVQDVFNQIYEKNNSPLLKENRLHSHNQILTYGVSFGIIGIFWFLFCLIQPLFNKITFKDFSYLAFFSIFALSILTEDTLETQVGTAFFAFFSTVFILQSNPKNSK